MAQEGIATLPMSLGNAPQTVSTRDALDASKQALAQTSPENLQQYDQVMNDLVNQIDVSPQEIDMMLQVLDYILQNEANYPQIRQQLIASGQLEEDDLPPEFDRGYFITLINVLHEKQDRMTAPVQQFNTGGLAQAAESLRRQGRHGDTMLAHINEEEAAMLKRMGGKGTINPNTGLPEFGFFSKVWKAVTKPVKEIASSTIGRVVLTVALGAVLGPAGLGLSSALAGGIAAAGTTLAAGGSLKDALISGAVGGISMGLSPSVSAYMPGATGGFLNTALSAGAVGTGIGLLSGQKLSQALKTGALAGVTAGGIGALSNQMAPTTEASPTTATPGADQPQGLNSLPSSVKTADQAFNTSTDVATPGSVTATNPQGSGQTNVLTPNQVTAANPQGNNLPSLDWKAPSYNITAPPPSGISTLPNAAAASSPGFLSNTWEWAKANPMTATGLALGAAGAAGGFKTDPVMPTGLTNPSITGETLIAQNPGRYIVGGLPGVNYTPQGGINYAGSAPANTAPQSSGSFMTPAYGGNAVPTYAPPVNAATAQGGRQIAQPYNTAAMYDFMPFNQRPMYMRSGGISQVYPRRTGQIAGPGTETSDDIPAMLSDGEFVITAKAVRGIGNGSRRDGAKKLYRMMHAMEKKAGGKV